MVIFKRNWWRSIFNREQYRAFRMLYEAIVNSNAATHEATVVNKLGEVFTALIVGYSDKHLYLRHTDRTVSYHEFYDVLSVDRIRDDEEHTVYVRENRELRQRLNACSYYFVRFPDDPKYEQIRSLDDENRGVGRAFNFGSGLSSGSRLISLYLKVCWNRYHVYLPEEIEIIAEGKPIPVPVEPHDIYN